MGSCHPLSFVLHKHIKHVVSKKNKNFAALLIGWSNIIAPEWDTLITPVSLSRFGTLCLAVQSAASLDFHYYKGVLIEKVNLFLGVPAVKTITVVQKTTFSFLPIHTEIKESKQTTVPKNLEEALDRLQKTIEEKINFV